MTREAPVHTVLFRLSHRRTAGGRLGDNAPPVVPRLTPVDAVFICLGRRPWLLQQPGVVVGGSEWLLMLMTLLLPHIAREHGVAWRHPETQSVAPGGVSEHTGRCVWGRRSLFSDSASFLCLRCGSSSECVAEPILLLRGIEISLQTLAHEIPVQLYRY